MSERYEVPESADRSFEAMRERLIAVQPQLGQVMTVANNLFDQLIDRVPHPSDGEFTIYRTGTADRCPVERVPVSRELTVVLDGLRWVRAFRTTDSAPDAYPRQRLWYWQPTEVGNLKTDILRTHEPRRANYPYDIEIAEYDHNGFCIGFVGGADYHAKEPYIKETSDALDEAKYIAESTGFTIS